MESVGPLTRVQSWVAIAIMLSGTSFMSLVVAAVSPIMHDISEHFGQGGYGQMVAQAIATIPAIGIIFGGPITGWAIERVGVRALLLAILAIFGVAGSAGLYVDNVWVLIGTRFVLGFAAAGIVTSTLIMIGDYFTPERRTRILGYQYAIGAVVAFSIIRGSGQLASVAGWRAPFALYLLSFLLLILTAIFIPSSKAKKPVARVRREQGSIVELWPIFALIVPLFIGSFMSTIQISFLLAADGIVNPAVSSQVISVGAITVGLGSAIYGFIRSRVGDSWTLRLCMLTMAVGIAVMGTSHAEPLVTTVGNAILGLGTGLVNPHVTNLLISRAAANARGRAVGLGYTSRYVGDLLNPVVVHPLALAFGIHSAFLIVGAALAVGAFLAVRLPRPVAVPS